MTAADPGPIPPCSVRSIALDEPLVGTASRIRRWLLVEQPGRWGHEALGDSELPPDVGEMLRDLGNELGVRVLLIKRRDRPVPSVRRCFVAYTGVRERRVASLEVAEPRELLSLDLGGAAGRRWVGFGAPMERPLVLVCTHGKHDQCCAREGTPVAAALVGFPRAEVWEATHVGGDRFAGNLVCFPHGIYLGRVTLADAVRAASAYADGRIPLELYRGRSCYSPAVQFAEHAVRERSGLDGVDDLRVVSHERVGRIHRVRFASLDGEEHDVEVEVGRLRPRPLTCKAEHPHRPRGFRVRSLA